VITTSIVIWHFKCVSQVTQMYEIVNNSNVIMKHIENVK